MVVADVVAGRTQLGLASGLECCAVFAYSSVVRFAGGVAGVLQIEACTRLQLLLCILRLTNACVVLESDLRVRPQGLRTIQHLLFLNLLCSILLQQLAILRSLLGLVLPLSAGLTILKNTVCASDGR